MTVDGLAARRSPHGCVWPAAWYRPHASAWAVWSKLSDANALTARSASTLLDGAGGSRSLFAARPDAPWLLEAHTLTAADRHNACVTAIAFAADAVESRWVRFCLACLSSGYHAGCLQHRAVTRCPIHDLPLQEHCPHCGRRIPAAYDVARAAPFGCRSCGMRLAHSELPRRLAVVQTVAMASTTAALTNSVGHTSAAAGRRRSQPGRSSSAGHVSWWYGPDPFVAGSGWTPQSINVRADDASGLQRAAWQALIRFVESRVPDVSLRARVLVAAEALERRNRCVLTEGLSHLDWAVAALIARYGLADYVRAQRLLQRGCHASLFPFVPQASSVVHQSGEANATVFAAEVRTEYLRMLKWTRNVGRDPLFEADLAAQASLVPWHLRDLEGDQWLHWRGLRQRRFNRVCAGRHSCPRQDRAPRGVPGHLVM